MCQHLTIEEMIRRYRKPPPGGVCPTERDLMEKLFTLIVRDNLKARAVGWYAGRYRRQLDRVSDADVVVRLMEKVVRNPRYTPKPGGFTSYAINNLADLGSELAREDNREKRAVLNHAAGATPAQLGEPCAHDNRALLKHGNATIPNALTTTTHPDINARDKVIFAAALIAGMLPKLQACNGLNVVPLGKVGLRKLIAQTDMPAGTTNEIWGAILRWKSRKTQKKRPRRRGVQTLLAGCCGLSISTVSRSLASTRLRLAEPYKAAVARVVEAVRRERMESSADDPT